MGRGTLRIEEKRLIILTCPRRHLQSKYLLRRAECFAEFPGSLVQIGFAHCTLPRSSFIIPHMLSSDFLVSDSWDVLLQRRKIVAGSEGAPVRSWFWRADLEYAVRGQ